MPTNAFTLVSFSQLIKLHGFADPDHVVAKTSKCGEGKELVLKLNLIAFGATTGILKFCLIAQRIVKVLELAGAVMDELANPTGPRRESINNHVREFMQLIKVCPIHS